MVNLKPTKQPESSALTTTNRELRFHHLLGLILISVLIHSLGLFLYAKFQPKDSNLGKQSASKPIDFVVVPPPESTEKKPPQSQEQNTNNSEEKIPAEPETSQAEQTTTSPPVVPAPEAIPVTPATPKVVETPKLETPESETPILSGSDQAQVPTAEAEPEAEPEVKPQPQKPEPTPAPPSAVEKPVASALPSSNSSKPSPAESIPTDPADSIDETDKIATGSGAASLLGGDLQKNYEEDGAQAFFSPEALEYEAVLDPQQLQALKGFDLEGYQKRLYDRVKRNWKPSFRQKYTTWLTFNIEKNGQISQLQVVESSGSEEFDQVALEAVQDAVPLEPLPPDFPLENLEFKYQFYLY